MTDQIPQLRRFGIQQKPGRKMDFTMDGFHEGWIRVGSRGNGGMTIGEDRGTGSMAAVGRGESASWNGVGEGCLGGVIGRKCGKRGSRVADDAGRFWEFRIRGCSGSRGKEKLGNGQWRRGLVGQRGTVRRGVDIQGRATSSAEQGGKLGRPGRYGR